MTSLRPVTDDPGDRRAVIDNDIRADAIDVLADALKWRLTEARWSAQPCGCREP